MIRAFFTLLSTVFSGATLYLLDSGAIACPDSNYGEGGLVVTYTPIGVGGYIEPLLNLPPSPVVFIDEDKLPGGLS